MTAASGVARVTSEIEIERESAHYPGAIKSTELQLASYAQPVTSRPSYEGFFDDIRNPAKASEQVKEFQGYTPEGRFLVAVGAGLEWNFEGGTNYWSDNDYRMETSGVERYLGRSWVSQSQSNHNTMYFDCDDYYESDSSVTVTLQNVQTRNLLRPQRTTINLRVACVKPVKAKLFWAQKLSHRVDEFVEWPRSIIEDGLTTFQLANN